jgi:hypothetical protein
MLPVLLIFLSPAVFAVSQDEPVDKLIGEFLSNDWPTVLSRKAGEPGIRRN